MRCQTISEAPGNFNNNSGQQLGEIHHHHHPGLSRAFLHRAGQKSLTVIKCTSWWTGALNKVLRLTKDVTTGKSLEHSQTQFPHL